MAKENARIDQESRGLTMSTQAERAALSKWHRLLDLDVEDRTPKRIAECLREGVPAVIRRRCVKIFSPPFLPCLKLFIIRCEYKSSRKAMYQKY